ncbi:MAG: hypothetical protein K2Y29_21430 [Beijerinckiaceae bacterium]|nr:hypothetical protein [Beijerinckiaceae bacterium]
MMKRSYVAAMAFIALAFAGGYALTHRAIRHPIQQALGIDLALFDFDSSDLKSETYEAN